MTNDQNLRISVAQLARSSRTNWNQFLQEYRRHCEDLANQLVSSDRVNLEIAQGRARHARELLAIFENSERDAEQIQKRTT